MLEPIFRLLESTDSEVQRASSAAIGNLAVNGLFLFFFPFLFLFLFFDFQRPVCLPLFPPDDNKTLIVEKGGLKHLVRLLLSPFSEVQCNACGCLTNLATSAANKVKIANSGAVPFLVRLANAEDVRVQRNSTGALLNLTHAGGLFYFVFFLSSSSRWLNIHHYYLCSGEPCPSGKRRGSSCFRQALA